MGDKSPKPSKEYTKSNQTVWSPQSEALEGLYKGSTDWYNSNSGNIGQAAGEAGNFSQGARSAVQQPWLQNLQGGNLAGYNIGGELSNRMGQNRDINGGQVGISNVNANNIGYMGTSAQQFGAGNDVRASGAGDRLDVMANQFGAGPGVTGTQMGQGRNVNGTNVSGSNVNGQNIGANAVGQLDSTSAQGAYDSNVGPGGSLDNMKGMYRQDADNARDDMLGSMDARAAASGMSGGSGHGNAIGRGQQGINQNLQSQMAQTGYDAYNRDLDRQLNIAGNKDNMNQQRAGWDQQNAFNTQSANQQNNMRGQLANQANNLQAQGMNQATNMQGQLANQNNQYSYDAANQGANMQAQMANMQNRFNTNQANQGANLQGQMANQNNQFNYGQQNQNANLQAQMANQQNRFNTNQSNQAANLQSQQGNQQNWFNTGQANQGANLAAQQGNQQSQLSAAQGNQQSNIDAGKANQNYASGQQQQLGNLMGQQQGASENAIGQQQQIQDFINGPLQSIMQSAGGLQMLQSLLGGPNNLTNSMGVKNGGTGGGGASYNIGTSGVNASF